MQPRILYVTDLDYVAQGRVYGDEDRWLTAELGAHFDIDLCNPRDVTARMDDYDAVVVRNSGPVAQYRDAYGAFRRAALERNTIVFNELRGRADMIGKQYLVDLTAAGAAVIPTIDDLDEFGRLPAAREYVVKPKDGADSAGLRVVTAEDLPATDGDRPLLIQPRVEFDFEISLYFVDRDFHYALYAPDPARRWDLRPYQVRGSDLAFAQWFVDWNGIDHGIQRVDACCLPGGELLLMELEDLNPYLSLDVLDPTTRARFVDAMCASIKTLLARGSAAP